MPGPKLTNEIITAALAGFDGQKKQIDEQIAELRSMLSGVPAGTAATTPEVAAPGRRKKRSLAVRKRMAEAQRLRWLKLKGETEPESVSPELPTPKPAKAKRKISAQGMKNIIAATKKRWKRQRAAAKAQSIPATKASKKAIVKTAKKTAPAKAAKKAVKKAVKKSATKAVAPAVAQAAV